VAVELLSVRVDVWTWAVRLYATRSAASTACRGGHVKVNGANAKPAHAIRIGDTVRAFTPGGERIVTVTGLLSKRVGASIAVQNFEDHSPPPVPRDEAPAPVQRERGSGRPTKRDRRQVERLRGRG
jgi:ribosome-associated heat shock protein Hsp15